MKQVVLVGNADTAVYDEKHDAYFAGVVLPDDAEIVVTDLIIQTPGERATIYYVIAQTAPAPDEVSEISEGQMQLPGTDGDAALPE